jgi:hypothetical protein
MSDKVRNSEIINIITFMTPQIRFIFPYFPLADINEIFLAVQIIGKNKMKNYYDSGDDGLEKYLNHD